MVSNSLACIDTSLFMQVRKVLSAAKDVKERCQNRKKKKKKKKLTRAFPFGLARFRFNEVRINEVPLYLDTYH